MPVVEELPTVPSPPFRLDAPLHNLLQQPSQRPPRYPRKDAAAPPVSVFPQHPELLHELDMADTPMINAHGATMPEINISVSHLLAALVVAFSLAGTLIWLFVRYWLFAP